MLSDVAICEHLKKVAQGVPYAQAEGLCLGLRGGQSFDPLVTNLGIGENCKHPCVPSAAMAEGSTKASAQRW